MLNITTADAFDVALFMLWRRPCRQSSAFVRDEQQEQNGDQQTAAGACKPPDERWDLEHRCHRL